MKFFRKLALFLSLGISLGCTSCLNIDSSKKTIALLFPNKINQRYVEDAKVIANELTSKNYNVITQFAFDEIETQISQVENMISLGVDALVIFAIDSVALVGVEKTAKNAGIPIIAYDRLLMETDAISYYYTFDNFYVGVLQGEYIKQTAKLDEVRQAGDHKTIEFFSGAQSDNNAFFFYDGMMSILKEYLDDQTLICRTGRTSMVDTSIADWSQLNALNAAENYLSGFYPNNDLDIAYCACDALASGVISALTSARYTSENWPIVTGQDSELINIKYIKEGKQSMTIYKNGNVLGKQVAVGIDDLLSNRTVEVNDTDSYFNGVKYCDSYLCNPLTITKENYHEELIETGYFTEEQIS